MLDRWDRHGLKVTSHMTGQAVEPNRSWPKKQWIAVTKLQHTARPGRRTGPMSPGEEKACYVANSEALLKATGTQQVGYNAFWLRGTPRTLPILQELGFTYHTDDLSRDEPMTTQFNGEPFAIVP